jgi:hypothetical protein
LLDLFFRPSNFSQFSPTVLLTSGSFADKSQRVEKVKFCNTHTHTHQKNTFQVPISQNWYSWKCSSYQKYKHSSFSCSKITEKSFSDEMGTVEYYIKTHCNKKPILNIKIFHGEAPWSSGELQGLTVWAMVLGCGFNSGVHLKTRWIRWTTWWQKKEQK